MTIMLQGHTRLPLNQRSHHDYKPHNYQQDTSEFLNQINYCDFTHNSAVNGTITLP